MQKVDSKEFLELAQLYKKTEELAQEVNQCSLKELLNEKGALRDEFDDICTNYLLQELLTNITIENKLISEACSMVKKVRKIKRELEE